MSRFFYSILLLFTVSLQAGQQGTLRRTDVQDQAKGGAQVDSLGDQTSPRLILAIVENAFKEGEWSGVQEHFADPVSMSVGKSDAAYVSALQAVSILNAFVAKHKPLAFSFTRVEESQMTPFATGRWFYVERGVKKSAQVYVSLTRADSRWRVSQISVFQ